MKFVILKKVANFYKCINIFSLIHLRNYNIIIINQYSLYYCYLQKIIIESDIIYWNNIPNLSIEKKIFLFISFNFEFLNSAK